MRYGENQESIASRIIYRIYFKKYLEAVQELGVGGQGGERKGDICNNINSTNNF